MTPIPIVHSVDNSLHLHHRYWHRLFMGIQSQSKICCFDERNACGGCQNSSQRAFRPWTHNQQDDDMDHYNKIITTKLCKVLQSPIESIYLDESAYHVRYVSYMFGFTRGANPGSAVSEVLLVQPRPRSRNLRNHSPVSVESDFLSIRNCSRHHPCRCHR